MSSGEVYATQFAIRLPDGNLYLSPMSGAVVTWSERAGAEYVMEQLRAHATHIGAGTWDAQIVYRYCTPFVCEGDDAGRLVDELTAWLQRETGGGR